VVVDQPTGRSPRQWNICLVASGRGWGKSRTASEWLVQRCLDFPADRSGFPTEWLVIAAKRDDALKINMDGASGIRRVLARREIPFQVKLSPSPMIVLSDSGVRIHFQGADKPDVGRGFNAAGATLDEVCKWPYPTASWEEGIQLSLRADLPNDHPRVLVTTTPKPIPLLREWVEDSYTGSVIIIKGSIFDNSANLATHALRKLEKKYHGTRLGRQELYGELLDDIDGALFSFSHIENNRVQTTDGVVFTHTTVGVDPTLTDEGDLMGVVVVGRSADNHMYVIADESIPASVAPPPTTSGGCSRSGGPTPWRWRTTWARSGCTTSCGTRSRT
jgi:phage terminase large subunit-like protein